MDNLVQSKFELVHVPDSKQVKHGDVTLEGVQSVEKLDVDGVPYVVIKAALGAETYDVGSKFVLAHTEDGESLKHGGVTLEGIESITKSEVDGVVIVEIKAALAGENFTAILKAKKEPEAKKPEPKVAPVAKPKFDAE